MDETDDLEWDDKKERENVAERGLPFAFASLILTGGPRRGCFTQAIQGRRGSKQWPK